MKFAILLLLSLLGLARAWFHMSSDGSIREWPHNKVCKVTDHGGKADGKYINTDAIKKAIDDCKDGGTVLLEDDRYSSPNFKTGTITLYSEVCLWIGENVMLQGSSDPDNWNGHLIGTHSGSENVVIRGTSEFTSVIDGNGKKIRPHTHSTMVAPNEVTGLAISNVLLRAPPSFTIGMTNSKHIWVHDIKVDSYGYDNGDGVDPEGCENVLIENAFLDSGDDCVAIKGKDGKKSSNIVVRNVTCYRGHGLSIGGDTGGGITDVTFTDCTCNSPSACIRIKTKTKDNSNTVSGITYTNIVMDNPSIGIQFDQHYEGTDTSGVMKFDGVEISNVRGGAKKAFDLQCTSGRCKNILLTDINLESSSTGSCKGLSNHEDGNEFSGVRPEISCSSAQYVA